MCDMFDSDNEEDGPTRCKQIFFPALSTQRYDIVIEELLRHEEFIDQIVDFGCNEGKFLKKAKERLHRVPLIFGVDLDETILNVCAESLKPDPNDLLYKLDYPLRMKLFAGNIAQYDRRLEDVDAVVAIELIEHLNYYTLNKFPEVVFGRIQPFTVILTTPNVEYNVLFNMEGRRFRNDDHKFEWTRVEFQKWCDDITIKYRNYGVKYLGVGEPPFNKKHIGFCTQIAVFRMMDRIDYLQLRNKNRAIRLKELEQFSEPGYLLKCQDLETDASILQPYKLAYDIIFPSKDSEAREGRMVIELLYYCKRLMEFRKIPLENVNGSLGIWFLLKDLTKCPTIKRYVKSEADLAMFLIEQGWMINLQNESVFYEHKSAVIQNSTDDEDELWTKDNDALSSSDDDLGVTSLSFGDACSTVSINADDSGVSFEMT